MNGDRLEQMKKMAKAPEFTAEEILAGVWTLKGASARETAEPGDLGIVVKLGGGRQLVFAEVWERGVASWSPKLGAYFEHRRLAFALCRIPDLMREAAKLIERDDSVDRPERAELFDLVDTLAKLARPFPQERL